MGGLYYIALRFVFRDWKHMVNAAKQTIEKLEVLAAARDDERRRRFGLGPAPLTNARALVVCRTPPASLCRRLRTCAGYASRAESRSRALTSPSVEQPQGARFVPDSGAADSKI